MKVSEEGKYFKKTMCCYFNIGLDAYISNCKHSFIFNYLNLLLINTAFEGRRTKYKPMNKSIYAYLAVKNFLCRCDHFGIKDFIESVIEHKEDKEHPILEHKHIMGNPKLMIGTNMPSVYGGQLKEVWYANRNRKGIHKDYLNEDRF